MINRLTATSLNFLYFKILPFLSLHIQHIRFHAPSSDTRGLLQVILDLVPDPFHIDGDGNCHPPLPHSTPAYKAVPSVNTCPGCSIRNRNKGHSLWQ